MEVKELDIGYITYQYIDKPFSIKNSTINVWSYMEWFEDGAYKIKGCLLTDFSHGRRSGVDFYRYRSEDSGNTRWPQPYTPDRRGEDIVGER